MAKKQEPHKIVPASYLFLVRDDKILLARRCNTSFMDGFYGLVAGHGEENEPAKLTLCREAKEEAGLIIRPDDLKLVHIMHRKAAKDERVDFIFCPSSFKGEPQIMEKEKCDDMRWFSIKNIPSNTIDYIKEVIDNCNKGIFYSEFGW